MSREFRSVASVLVGIVLLGVLTVAQASANSDKSTKNEGHHSRLSKAAFWKHHKHQDKAAKPSPTTPKKVQAQKAQPKSAQLKQVSAKKTTGTKNQNQNQVHPSKSSKSSARKSTAVAKTNTSKKPNSGQTSSFKQ